MFDSNRLGTIFFDGLGHGQVEFGGDGLGGEVLVGLC